MGSAPRSSSTPDSRKPRFWEVALANGLFSLQQLESAEAAIRARPNLADATPAAWDAALADCLVEQGSLSGFQARELLAGRTVFRLGAYVFLDELGKGGMGQVFKAEHALMGRLVAVKVLPRSKSTPESEAAFRREMRILGRLDHPNLVRAFDAGYEKGVHYLVTELVPGVNLRQLVRQSGPLDEHEAASVFAQVATGLSYAHEQGLVHRDVKPGNILVMEDGRAKLLDMGLAGSTLEAEALRLGRVVGTMDYIAPEQIRGPDDVGPSADIYGLGCSIYFALTGQVPFPDGSRREKMQRHINDTPVPLRTLAPQTSEAFGLLVEAMMAKSPSDRIDSAPAVIRRLRRWIPPTPIPLPRQGPRPASRSVGWLPQLRLPGAHAREQQLALQFETDAPRPEFADRLVGGVRRLVVPALIAGGTFYGLVWLVSSLDPVRFKNVFSGYTPATFGVAAFVLMLFLQGLTLLTERQED
jgi:hypothetical protein